MPTLRLRVTGDDASTLQLTDALESIEGIEHIEEIQGVPVAVSCEFRLLPFTHPVYKYEIEGQSLV